jgi:hypothetical protein
MAEAASAATAEEELALRELAELAELAGDMPRADGRIDQGATQPTAEAPATDSAGPAVAPAAVALHAGHRGAARADARALRVRPADPGAVHPVRRRARAR